MNAQLPLAPEQYVRLAVLDTLGAPVGDGELEMWNRIAYWVETGEVPADGAAEETHADIKICRGCGAACYADETCGRCEAQAAPDADQARWEQLGAEDEPAGMGYAARDEMRAEDEHQVLRREDVAAEQKAPRGERRAAVVTAIKTGHQTFSEIQGVTGIPRGSMSGILKGMVDDGLIRRDDSGAQIIYRLVEQAAEPVDQAEPVVTLKADAAPPIAARQDADEELKRQWLAENEPSREPNLGPHKEMVEYLRRDLCMFVARLPAGTIGRAQWRYGTGTVDTAKLYAIGNAERKRRGLDPIPMPKESRS